MIGLGLCKSQLLTIYIVYPFLCLQDFLENNKMRQQRRFQPNWKTEAHL